jgi:branched-chain amino acid transport system permease protein
VTANGYFFLPQYFSWLIPTNLVPQMPLFGRLSITGDSELYYTALVTLVLVLVGVRSLRNSHAGRAMIASNDNRLATQSFALSTVRIQLMAFAISGALAGLAGALYVILESGFNAGDFAPQDGINFFLMVVIGGLGSIPGAVLGAVYVYGVQYLLPANYGLLATGLGVVVILIIIPGGLGEVVFRIRDGILRAYANRIGLYVPSLLADRRVTSEVAATPEGLGDRHLGDAAAASAAGAQPVPVDLQGLAGRETVGAKR